MLYSERLDRPSHSLLIVPDRSEHLINFLDLTPLITDDAELYGSTHLHSLFADSSVTTGYNNNLSRLVRDIVHSKMRLGDEIALLEEITDRLTHSARR